MEEYTAEIDLTSENADVHLPLPIADADHLLNRQRSRSRSPHEWKRPDHRGSDKSREASKDRERVRSRDRAGDQDDKNIRIKISNIPYDLKYQQLKDMCFEIVGTEVLVDMETKDGRNFGSAIVEVQNRDMARKIIDKLHRSDISGRVLVVRELYFRDNRDTRDDRRERNDSHRTDRSDRGGGDRGRSYDRSRGESNRGGDYGRRGRGGDSIERDHRRSGGGQSGSSNQGMAGIGTTLNGGGFTLQSLAQAGIDFSNLTTQVFVANLDYKASSAKLEEIFRIAGNVLNIELKKDGEGKSRGLATVRFEHPIEAVQAISLFNGQTLYDRPISVRMDRWVEPTLQEIPRRLPSGLQGIGVGLGVSGQPLQSIGQIANNVALTTLQANACQNSMGMLGANAMAGLGNNAMAGMGAGLNNQLQAANMLGLGGMAAGNNLAAILASLGGNAAAGFGVNMGGAMGGAMGGVGGTMGGAMGSMATAAGNMGGVGAMGATMGGMGAANMANQMGAGLLGNNYPGLGNMDLNALGGGSMAGSNMTGNGFSMDRGAADNNIYKSADLGSSLLGNIGMERTGGSDVRGYSGNDGSSARRDHRQDYRSVEHGSRGGDIGGDFRDDNRRGSSDRADTHSFDRNAEGGCAILVKNLPYTFTWQNLTDLFRDFGDVKAVELKMENGLSRGWGVVQFGSSNSARQAIHMVNGLQIEGQTIEIRLI